MNDTDALVKEFLVESYENLDQLDRDLVVLEKEPQNRDRLASVFRTVHTIKGTCGFFGYAKLESVTHIGENLLSKLRDGALVLNPERTTALLSLVDAIRQMLNSIEAHNREGDVDYTPVIDQLTRLQQTESAAAEPAHEIIATEPAPEVAATPAEPPAPPPAAAVPDLLTFEFPEHVPVERVGEYLVKQQRVTPEQLQDALSRQSQGDRRWLGKILVDDGVVKPEDVANAVKSQSSVVPTQLQETNIRVDVNLLERLMTLVGELVLARNQILQYSSAQTDATLISTTQRLNQITTALQEGVMKTRMQPIGNVWSRFPRVVRDLATLCNKQVRLELEGKETELDKSLIEAIKDPLTHVVRNSVDHGIESPEARVAAGKPAEGRIHLRAFHEGGQVNIEISDDGAGIDPSKIKAKAVARGLITGDQAAKMSDREIIRLVFLPGFSTAEKVTNVSGRGVGMDVVKTNIEKIGGTVDLQSRPGDGTTLKIKIPLTLAIIPALVVTSGGDRYCIPQVSLLELVRLEGDQVRRGIERVHDAPVYRLRGQLLPLVDLNQKLGTGDGALTSDVVNIVVLQADQRPFGLVVDGINDTEEIVVKPLSKLFKGVPLFAGATIMGDGRVSLILDVLGLAQQASVLAEGRDRRRSAAAGSAAGNKNVRHLLIARVGYRRVAIPLSLVSRLEEIPLTSIETGAGKSVVQYRGRLMPLVVVRQALGDPEDEAARPEAFQVVVYNQDDNMVGLVVDEILDVAETAVDLTVDIRRPGLLGTGVVQDKVTDFLDLAGIAQSAVPEFLAEVAS